MTSHLPPGAEAPAPQQGEASSWSGPATSPRRLIVGPFNRVEGDLEVRLDISSGAVHAAWVNSPMYRGFEQMLPGRDALDALVIVPRICGICSVSQSIAAAHALAELTPAAMPPNGRHVLNAMHAVENLADHLSHFYLFFMPDFTRAVYADRAWHAEALRRFAPGGGEAQRAAIAARQRWFTLLGTLGGKWPHTQSIQPGGSSRAVDASEQLRLLARVREFRAFLEQQLFSDRLEAVAALDSPQALERWRAAAPGQGDFRLWLDIAEDLRLETLGPGPRRYLSFGAYAQPDGGFAFAEGLLEDGVRQPVDLEAITEDLSHGWYAELGAASPAGSTTLPQADKPGAYSWAKAPRYRGRVLETGALARQCIAGHPLVTAEEARTGGNVATRVLARVLELALVVPQVENWLRALRPGEPFHAKPAGALRDGRAVGRTEAARGSLAHWIEVKDGRLAHYQIVAPTTWNFSPRDVQGTPGPLEAALVGAPVRPGETTPVAVQHIVRSFDPCMVCTVH